MATHLTPAQATELPTGELYVEWDRLHFALTGCNSVVLLPVRAQFSNRDVKLAVRTLMRNGDTRSFASQAALIAYAGNKYGLLSSWNNSWRYALHFTTTSPIQSCELQPDALGD